jgi:hypothetical protein
MAAAAAAFAAAVVARNDRLRSLKMAFRVAPMAAAVKPLLMALGEQSIQKAKIGD